MFALAFACGAIGGFLMSYRGIIHPFLSIVIANVFVLSNPVIILAGVLRFRKVRSKIRIIGPVFLILLVPLLSYSTFVEPDLNARIVVMSIFFGIQALLCAYTLVTGIDKKLVIPAYSTACFFVFATTIMLLRIVTTLFHGELTDYMASGNSQSLLQLSHIIYVSGVTFGFIWLNTRKLGLNLATALQGVDDGIQSQFSFIDMISHELKTPLSTIQNSVETLFMRLEKEMTPARKRAFERINRSLVRLDNIIEVSLKQKRLTTKQIIKNIEAVSIVELLHTSAEVCKETFPEHKVILTYHRSFSGLVDIPADQSALLTALNNVLHNAMKYSPSQKHVSVEIGTSGKMITVAVKDRGCGIAPKNRERVFEKYFREKKACAVSGSGLGLFIVRHIIEAHNGTVTIKNGEPVGCQVDICLPLDCINDAQAIKSICQQ